jgi:hypothetical protein
MRGYDVVMSDEDPEQFAEFTTQDGPGSAGAGSTQDVHPEQEHPEQEAHGGSMAPQLVDDTGHPTEEPPPTAAGR